MADESLMDDVQNRLRITQLRTVDTFAHSIVQVAGRTALYNYDQSKETWSKTKVEGTLMIYTRTAKPKHMITIINKNSKNNFIEAITRNCDAQLKAPYVLLRNDAMNILGIWFADQSDVPRVYDAIGNIIKIEEQLNSALAGSSSAISLASQPSIAPLLPGSSNHQIAPNSMDIMSMLSRAHGEFETKKGDGVMDNTIVTAKSEVADKPLDLVKPSPVKMTAAAVAPKTTPATKEKEESLPNLQQPPHNTVADFFAKVNFGPPLNSSTTRKPLQHREKSAANLTSSNASKPSAAVDTASNNCNANPVLQQMFQGAAAVGGQASVNNNNCIGSNPATIPQRSRESLVQNCKPSSAGVVGSLQKAGQPAPMSVQELEGKFRENLSVGPPSSAIKDSFVPFNDLLLGVSPTRSKPNLIGPQMFTIGGNSLIDDLSPNNNSVQKNQGLQPLMPQEDHSQPRRGPSFNNNEMNTVSFRIVPQTPPGLSTTLTSPHAVSHTVNSSVQNLLMSNAYNSSNNNNTNNNPSNLLDRLPANCNDHSILESRPPGILQPSQPPSQQKTLQGRQQDRQTMLLTQDQLVTAFTHALTKEEFVKQLYQAYEESVLLKLPKF